MIGKTYFVGCRDSPACQPFLNLGEEVLTRHKTNKSQKNTIS